jgi:WD40 repeat protein
MSHRTQRLFVSIAFRPDGEIVALGGDDGQVHLLEAVGLREISSLSMPTKPHWTFVSFDSDGAQLYAVDERGRIVRWETRPQAWIDRACRIVGRDFTESERDRYLPGVELEGACPGVAVTG